VQALGTHALAVVNVILLGGDHGQVVLFVTSIFAELDAAHNLLIDEIGGHRIVGWLMPRRENLFAKEETSWCVAFLRALLFRIVRWRPLHGRHQSRATKLCRIERCRARTQNGL
jgi:hypothetical protein